MAEKRTIMRHGAPVAQTFVPTERDKVERQIYDFSKGANIKDLLTKVNENNKLLKEILNKLDKGEN